MDWIASRKRLLACRTIAIISLLLSIVGTIPYWLKYEEVSDFVHDPIFDQEIWTFLYYKLVVQLPSVHECAAIVLSLVSICIFLLYSMNCFRKINTTTVAPIVFTLIAFSPGILPWLQNTWQLQQTEALIMKTYPALVLVNIYAVILIINEIKPDLSKVFIWIPAILLFVLDYRSMYMALLSFGEYGYDRIWYVIAFTADVSSAVLLQISILMFALREKKRAVSALTTKED